MTWHKLTGLLELGQLYTCVIVGQTIVSRYFTQLMCHSPRTLGELFINMAGTEAVESLLFDRQSHTDIPIVLGSYALLQAICKEQVEAGGLWDRRIVLEDAPGERLSPREATIRLQNNSLQLSSGRLDQ
jgi:hypothetical protein